MATKLIYLLDTGVIKAIIDDPGIDVAAVQSNWPNSGVIETDQPFVFEYLRYFWVNPATQQLERKPV